MDDNKIIQLYFDRDESAIAKTDEKYGRFCFHIADRILGSHEDSKECVDDTYLKTWNAIPPQRPNVFPAFIGKIARNLALTRYEMQRTAKRGGGQTAAVLDELDECIPDKNAEFGKSESDLSEAIDSFLDTLPKRNRDIFVLRYWYTESIKDIAKAMKMSENSVFAVLNRIRKKLRSYLSERGLKP